MKVLIYILIYSIIMGTKCNPNIIPIEIDTHYQLYGEHVWDYTYVEICEVCNGGTDKEGFCACGTGSD